VNKDCLFCRIAAGEIPSDIVFENERIVAFRDINPVAPVHILVIPKEHIASMAHLKEEHQALMGEIMTSIQKLAEQEKLDDGFRVVVNTGRDGGQTVSHLHFHLIGGRGLQWPPG
jgi:histidine triad (HIT) family protein